MTAKRMIVRERLHDAGPRVTARAPHALQRAGITDTLFNLATGMGTSKDKQTGTLFGFNEMPKAQLEAAYRGDWVSRKIIDIPAYDATREWRTWQIEAKDITKIEELEKSINLRKKTMMALQRSRLYGGGALVMGVDQGRPEDPLDIEKLGADCLKWVHPVSRWEMANGPIDWELSSPYFGTPAYYTRSLQAVIATAGTKEQIQQQAQMNARVQNSGMIKIHPSRIVRFAGLEPPEWNLSQGWGDSVLTVVADAVLSMGTISAGITALVHEAKLDVVKVPELSERISDKTYEARLSERFSTANLMKSLFSILLLDKEEDWERVTQVFNGMPEVMQEFTLMVCGAADIPATRFLGQSPKGMSATGDSDTRNYYDKVSTGQELEITPAMDILDKVIAISSLGTLPDGIFYGWNPLWQMDDAQRADIAVKQATVMAADVAAGLLDPMVMQKARENQLIESEFYPGIEQIIEEFGTDIDERTPPPTEAVPTHIDPETGQPADPATNPKAVPNPAHPDPFAGRAPPVPAPANENASPAAKKKAAAQDKELATFFADGGPGSGPQGGAVGKIDPHKGPTNEQKIKAAEIMHGTGSKQHKLAQKRFAKKDVLPVQREFLTADAAMAHRIRHTVTDASTPRTLYIYRAVLNWQDIAKHYKAQGVSDVMGKDQHVTVCYSKTPVDWLKVGSDTWGSDEDGNLTVKAGGPRVNEKFGKFLVLAFANSDLSWRHRSILEQTGGSWDYEDYTPHVSISKNAGAIDPMQIAPWTGPIVFGPECFEEIKPEYFENPGEKAKQTDATLLAVIDAIRNMPAPQVHVTVKNGKVIKEDIQIQHDANGRAVSATKTITESTED